MTPLVSNPSKSETLRFGYSDTSLGIIAVAESARGVVALFIGDNRAKLLNDLQSAFPEAEIVLDQAALARTVAKATALVEKPRLRTDMKLDLRGSPLEVAVWHALQSIPAGETRTYGAIAKALPIAATAQEVGAACTVSPMDRSRAIVGVCSASAGSSTRKERRNARDEIQWCEVLAR
jgi:AraC family transcriptional regulator, regulatory protein of adaptative response / methylated-DNA-[protein]-cysteine methyltransferase